MQPPEKKKSLFTIKTPQFQLQDYDRWQQTKRRPTFNLPDIKGDVASEKQKSKKKISAGLDIFQGRSIASGPFGSPGKNSSQKMSGKETEPEYIQTNIQILKAMLKFRRASLEELKKHVGSLTITNQELAKKIQDIEARTTGKVRKLLQQQDLFGTLISTLDFASHKEMERIKDKLQKWETQASIKLNELQRQMTKVKAKIHKTKEELNFLSTYMDQEYPIKSVQIENLMRQIQDVKDNNQEDLEELEELGKEVLQMLSKKLMVNSEQVLYVMAKKIISPYQVALMKRTLSNQQLLKQMVQFRVHIDYMKEQLPKLKAEVKALERHRKHPREVIFEDILLRKPKCTPDMDVILNIPQEEVLPF
ncbi:uncharacterized protein C20orf96 homolog isoform X2 [Monodelphis domestica]|uniref:uncharacterized protein C20orf96 homolog isoform X2 n=1 Tax=Monodelphis domestica TaxID=13616 RepID=UPI0024E19A53|nr:uncharacterized protein C20orf96 homolog isoform X2 [Monodelphis domestica]